MSNALIPISDMDRMAQAFSKSKLFGEKTPDQCMALLLLAQAEGQHPAIAMRDFDVIQGRPAKKAEAMLRSFLAAGGSVKWIRLDDEGAEATFSHPQGGTATISWDAARAKKAGLGNREMYGKYPRAMYRSRVVSEGCRTVYPAATSGLYVPEELRQILKEEKRVEKEINPKDIPADPDDDKLRALESAPGPASSSHAGSSPEASGPGSASVPECISADQHIDLADRLRDYGIAEDRALKAWKVKRVAELPADQYTRAKAWIERVHTQEIAGQP